MYFLVKQFPEFITSFFSRLSLPSMGNPPAAPSRNVLGSIPSHAGRQAEASILDECLSSAICLKHVLILY